MRNLLFTFFLLASVVGQEIVTPPTLRFRETDGSPTGIARTVEVSPGTLSFPGGSVARITTGGGAGGGSVLVNGATVSDPNFTNSSTALISVSGATNVLVSPTNIANAQIATAAAIDTAKLALSSALSESGTNLLITGNAYAFSLQATNGITNLGGLFVAGASAFTNDVTFFGTTTIGLPILDVNAGAVSLFNMSVTAGASGGTVESVTFPLDSNPMVVLYSQSNGAGAVTNRYVSMPDNDYIKTTAAGTAYQLTTTPAKVDLGTTDPTLTVTKTRTYRVKGAVYLEYNGATFAASQTVALKIRRTNNTAADIADSAWIIRLGVSTTLTAGVETIDIPECRYVGTAGDILEVWASVSVLPSVGSVDITQAYIVAQPIE